MIKSYTTPPTFEPSEIPPVHIGGYDGKVYFAFAEGLTPAPGGEEVSAEELTEVLSTSMLIRQIKTEAGSRIESVAPVWKQQNALSDILRLQGSAELSDTEQETLAKAQALLDEVERLRSKSNEIEALVLTGVVLEYNTDAAWAS